MGSRPKSHDWSAEASALVVALGGAVVTGFDAIDRVLGALGIAGEVSAAQQWVGVLVCTLLVYGWYAQKRYRRLAAWPDERVRELGRRHEAGLEAARRLTAVEDSLAPFRGGGISIAEPHPSVTNAWKWEEETHDWLVMELADFGFAPMFRNQPGGVIAGPDFHVAKAKAMVTARLARLIEIQALLLAHRRPSKDS